MLCFKYPFHPLGLFFIRIFLCLGHFMRKNRSFCVFKAQIRALFILHGSCKTEVTCSDINSFYGTTLIIFFQIDNYLFQSEKCKIESRQRLTFTVCSSRQESRHLTWYFRAWSCLLWATTFPPRTCAKSCWRVETIPQKSFRNTATFWYNSTICTQRHHCILYNTTNTAVHFSWWSLLHSVTF